MDDLVAALYLLADKLRVNVRDLSDRFVLYTQITSIVLFLVYMILAYVAYRVINKIHQEYVEGDPGKRMEQKAKLYKDEIKREVEIEMAKITRKAILSGVNAARICALAIFVGMFLVKAACEIPTIIQPQGAALESVLESMKDATKVEIVQPPKGSRGTKDDSSSDRAERDGTRSESGSE